MPILVYVQFWGYFKGTVMQIEKTQINDRLHVSNVS